MFVCIGGFADGRARRAADARDMKRRLLLAVAGLLCLAALLAIGILLVGHFGRTEGRILGTTMVLAGYGMVALPSVLLFERRGPVLLVKAGLGLAALAATVSIVEMWGFSDSRAAGKTVGTTTVLALAAAQAALVTARRRAEDPVAVRRLHPVSCATGAALALFASVLFWASPDSSLWPRLAGALLVLDVLLVALQPVLARAATDGGRPPRAAAHGH
jgi:hypothetical protein